MLKSIKKLFAFLLIIVSIYSLYADNKYPYQAPSRFNQDYQKSNYYLAGDIYFYTTLLPELTKFSTTSPRINPNARNSHKAEFNANTKYDLFSLFYNKTFDKEACKRVSLPKPLSSNEDTRIIFYPPGNQRAYSTILISRKKSEDTIVLYAGVPLRKAINGSKLTFNIDNFEKYMKTTAWFNSRPKLVGYYDSAITFGFAVNTDDSNFTVPKEKNSAIPDSFSINFVRLRENTITDCSPFPLYIEEIVAYTDTMKIAEMGIKNLNDDLYKPHTIDWHGTSITIPPIITIEPMNKTDFEEFQNLIKLGNSN